jgi:ATP-dependent Clp endopeptidase proteolytic subunit ClpP
MKNRTGTVPLEELSSGLPQRTRSVRLRANGERGKDWFRVVKNATIRNGEAVSEVYIYDEIGFWGTDAETFVQQLMEIDSPQIDLHLNSPGGEMWDGVAIYNALKSHKATVHVIVDGLAASAASFIAQAGNKVTMTKAATMMIHDASGLVWGNAADMRKTADLLDKLSDTIAGIYSLRSGGTDEEWRALMKEEVWYNAKEAVEAGLADEVGGESPDGEPENRWDLSIFAHAGRADSPPPSQVRTAVLNRVKETPVTQPATEGTPAPETPATPVPAAPEPPAEGAPAPDQSEVPGEPDEEQPGTGGEGAAGGTVPPTVNPPANSGVTVGTDGKVTVRLADGTVLTDPTAIQNHLTTLESFHKDTVEANRKGFVASLAKDGKILASKLGEVEAFALGLKPEQYEPWKATMDAVPTSSLLQTPPVQPAQGVPAESVDQTIQNLQDTVLMHKRGGMKEDTIKQTNSYKQLIALKPDFQL